MQPLFVVGAPRSGTSLVRDLLRLVEGVALPADEMQFVPALLRMQAAGELDPEVLARFLNKSNFAGHLRDGGTMPPAERISELAVEAAADVRRFLPALVAEIAAVEGIKAPVYWGDKTPDNIFSLQLLADAWPDMKLLHVLRDPRDTVLSMQKAWGRSPIRGAMIWARAAAAPLPAGVDLKVLRYEALIANPGVEMQAVAEWLGQRFHVERLADFGTRERWGTHAGKGGIGGIAEAWRKAGQDATVRRIEEIVWPQLSVTGYAPALATGPRPAGRLALQAAALGDTLRVLRHYADERGWRAAIGYKFSQWIGWRRG